MIEPAPVFGFANQVGLLFWAALLLSLLVRSIRGPVWLVTGLIVPALWAGLYILFLAQGLSEAAGGFQSIEGVRSLFASDSALTAGWLHYLAFDLFVGTWIAKDSVERRIHPLLVLPCLALTLLAGPAGLLLYLLLRLLLSRRLQREATA